MGIKSVAFKLIKFVIALLNPMFVIRSEGFSSLRQCLPEKCQTVQQEIYRLCSINCINTKFIFSFSFKFGYYLFKNNIAAPINGASSPNMDFTILTLSETIE